MKTYKQTPTEKIDYEVELQGGDVITSAVWTSVPSDINADTPGAALTIDTPTYSPTLAPVVTKARIYGARMNITYIVKVHIFGGTGQVYDLYFHIFGDLTGR